MLTCALLVWVLHPENFDSTQLRNTFLTEQECIANLNDNFTETVTGTYQMTIENTSSDALKITATNGGIELNSGNDLHKEILINSHVKFDRAMYYQPEILTTVGNSTVAGESGNIGTGRKKLGQNVLTILACDNTNRPLGTLNGNDDNWYCVLENGTYNGQMKKIVLHPIWDDTISPNSSVNIAINRFCDPDGSIYNYDYILDSTNVAQIILNKGGQSVNLIYIDDNSDDTNTTGYWMLLDNNFDFV